MASGHFETKGFEARGGETGVQPELEMRGKIGLVVTEMEINVQVVLA
jgi:hypothetical protein